MAKFLHFSKSFPYSKFPIRLPRAVLCKLKCLIPISCNFAIFTKIKLEFTKISLKRMKIVFTVILSRFFPLPIFTIALFLSSSSQVSVFYFFQPKKLFFYNFCLTMNCWPFCRNHIIQCRQLYITYVPSKFPEIFPISS